MKKKTEKTIIQMTYASLHKLSLIFRYCLLINIVHFTMVTYTKIISLTKAKNEGWRYQTTANAKVHLP